MAKSFIAHLRCKCYNGHMGIIFSKIAAIFLIMAAGFAINKSKLIPSEGTPYFVTMLVWITTPCMIYSSITTREYDPSILTVTVHMFILSLLFFLVSTLMGFFLCKYVFKVDPHDLGVYSASFGGINNGFMGFPITQAIFGPTIFYYMVISNICLNIYIYSACPLILHLGDKNKKFSMKYMLKNLLNPASAVCFISLFMMIKGWQLPGILFETIDMIGSITVPLSMLVVGMQLGQSNALKVLKNVKLVALSILKMGLIPLTMFLIVNWLPIDPGVKVGVIFAACFPCSVIISSMALLEKKNATLASEFVALTTLISIGSIPLFAVLLNSIYVI